MKCEKAQESIPLFLYGELSFDDEDRLEAHIDECAACRVHLEREKVLHRAVDAVELRPAPEVLRHSRAELRSQIQRTPAHGRTLWDTVRDFLFIRPVVQPAGALALIAMGFFGARMIPQGPIPGISSASLAEPLASRVRYVEPEAAGQVQIVVEETRQKTLSGNLGDARIAKLLLEAARDPADPGLRVESMDLLKSRPDMADVRTALIAAVQHDPNPGVRLKALDGLKSSAGDPEVRQALSRVLLTDKNPGVRTQVIDLLIQQKEQPQMVGVLQELMRKEDNQYVRMRCQRALHEMKASVETF